MALQAPIDRDTHRSLRAAVLALRESERRRRFARVLHVGTTSSSGTLLSHPEDAGPPHDDGLRVDIALAMLQSAARVGRPLIWLTRPGELSVHDADLAWGAAVGRAAGSAGLTCGLVVVTPRGWFDPVSDVRREWRRLRRSRSVAA